jgi:hypothetical protein
MIDVIDDDPTARWLSICFYGDTIEDPVELADFIHEGLLGQTVTVLISLNRMSLSKNMSSNVFRRLMRISATAEKRKGLFRWISGEV